MIVVSDSTPLITLMKAARIDLLHDLFGEIVIPEAVYQELTVNSKFPNEAKTIQESASSTVMNRSGIFSSEAMARSALSSQRSAVSGAWSDTAI